jgi:hypothetical protein
VKRAGERGWTLSGLATTAVSPYPRCQSRSCNDLLHIPEAGAAVGQRLGPFGKVKKATGDQFEGRTLYRLGDVGPLLFHLARDVGHRPFLPIP